MRAAVFYGTDRPLVIEDVRLADPAPREVRVRVHAAGICHSDVSLVSGHIPYPVPAVAGHESAGVVEAVGSSVEYVRPGDRVITCLSVFCGACERCLQGRPALCLNSPAGRASGKARLTVDGEPVGQFMHLGSFSEELLVHENAVVRVDPEIPFAQASLLGCGVTTGLGAVLRTARVRLGESVAVLGCGGVGLSAVQGAVIAGAARIIAVDTDPGKLDTALALGATDTVDASRGDCVAEIVGLTGGGVDHAFEVVGRKDTAEQAFGMLRPGGTATVVGVLGNTAIEIPGRALNQERRIQGSLMGSNRFRVDIPRYLDLYRQGRLRLNELVSREIGLDELDGALTEARSGRTGHVRTVVTFP